ncbi:DUF6515 family protein [Aquimarina sp. D1M17]|uniref:DUF6515 family protein n=1 Tax=Aquimarina acroporae TaxID=2937283 RepID=UPI0020BF7CF7|nr:DUF6515 family protein [Aquimarina acroporae]MCK8520768.1 DUF6515 family protein [Aquimarina acroporae]
MRTIAFLIKVVSILIIFTSTESAVAQRKGNSKSNRVATSRDYTTQKRLSTEHYNSGRCHTQPIRRNPYYRYPRHHRIVSTLPIHHVRVVYRGLPYFYCAGIYYTSYNNGYVVVIPPVGFRITVLPVGYTRIVIGPSVFYYHSGVYYKEMTNTTSKEEKYEITKPPVGTTIKEIHKDAEEVVIDGRVYYQYNDIVYKKISTYDGNTAFEVVYLEKES